jgi:hypothetical protein
MKIRWTADSIRLRITPSELQALLQNEIVRQSVQLGAGSWTARIMAGCARTDYTLVDGALQVNLSARDLVRLADPTIEGVYFEPSADQPVRLYIEKDLACEHPRAAEALEPETETFPAPAKSVSVDT